MDKIDIRSSFTGENGPGCIDPRPEGGCGGVVLIE
jgi:hypothetical protein